MSDNLNQEQPVPADGTGPDCWELVIADMRERRQIWIDKYGKPVRPDNGRDSLVDAYQEVLDLAVYLRAAIETMCGERAKIKRLLDRVAALEQAVERQVALSREVGERDANVSEC